MSATSPDGLRSPSSQQERASSGRGDATKVWRLWCSECIGTALLVGAGCSLVILDFGASSPVAALLPGEGTRRAVTGFLFGAVGALIAVSPVGRVSGAHVNPAVTLAFWLHGRMKAWVAVGYVVAQLAGGALGAAPLRLWGAMGASVDYGATGVGPAGPWVATLGEAGATFCLVAGLFVFLGHPRLRRFTPALFPFLYALLVWVEAPLSGTSTNPARSLGPALVGGHLGGWWVYWLGPLLGALGGAALLKAPWARSLEIRVAKVFHFHHDPYGIFGETAVRGSDRRRLRTSIFRGGLERLSRGYRRAGGGVMTGDVRDVSTSPPPAVGGHAAPDLSARSTAEAALELGTDLRTGLASPEAIARLARHGRNEVAEEESHPLRRFLGKFWGPSAWMIELVVVVSLGLHRLADVALGATLLVANAVLGALQEQRASAAVEALRSRLRVTARALRDERWILVPAAELVPGDVVRLRGGDFVPADAKLADGHLAIDQSTLTGESAVATKDPGDLVYSGSMVRRGEATALVVLTGASTYFGRTTALVASARPKLHVEEVVARVVRWLFVITGALTTLALVVAWSRGLPLVEILPLLLLLLLSAVPVALPVMFTVSMAVGATELSRRGVLVTRLSAAEDAATMDVLCADKTGTITENRLRVAAVQPEPGFTETDVLRLGAMASEESDQDPIDVAFTAAARERGLPQAALPRIEFLPFSAETRRTEAVFAAQGGRLRVVKGALRTVASACQLPPEAISALEARAAVEAAHGRRALAVARSAVDGRLELAGLALLHDAPRGDSRRLIAELRELGVKVKMLTGDALPVAREVARSVGLGEVVRASSLREELARGREHAAALASGSDGFAEVFPEDKYAVVEALQAAGHVVGMTGDGVNDAPALRQAEVGIAVSTAVDVAKASASVVLTEEGLTSIVQLVENGRVVYQRVLTWIANKVSRTLEKSGYVTLAFLATGRFVVSTFGMILLLFMTDFVKIALATDRMQGSRHPETWKIRSWIEIAVVLGALMLGENLALLAVGWDLFGLAGDLDAAQTFSFQALLYFALFSILSVRERSHFWRSRPSGILLAALGIDALVGVALPLADLPGLRPIPAAQTLTVIATAMLFTLGLNDAIKTALIRRAGLARAADHRLGTTLTEKSAPSQRPPPGQ